MQDKLTNEIHEKFKRVQDDPSELFAFFMQAPAPLVILTGSDHLFTLANPLYERMVGREVVGKKILEAFTREEVGDFLVLLDEVYRTGLPYVGQELGLTIPDENGQLEQRFLNVVYHPYRDVGGVVRGIFAIHQDVTEQVQARKVLKRTFDAVQNERENFRILFKQSQEMVCILRGPEHRFEFVNEAHIRALGFDATGMTVREAQPESVEVHGLLDNVFRTGETAHLHEIPVTLGDRLRYFQLTYSARRDMLGDIDGVMIVGAEITEQVLQRENLRQLTARLDQALRESEAQRNALARAKDEADRANAFKTAFLANMSHEIRTPLGAMLGFADLLQDPNLTLAQRNDYLKIITRNGESLSVIIDDILDLTKVEAGELTLQYTEAAPAQIARDVTALLGEKAKQKELILEVLVGSSTPKTIVSDPHRIRQVLLNLVGNAVKFTEKGSVTVKTEGEAGGGVRFEILDTGIGIQESQREKIFEVFVQGDDSTTRRFGGTGLGLTLSRSLARSLGGDIRLAGSTLAKGTEFHFTVADRPEMRARFAKTTKVESGTRGVFTSLSGIKVLVADDSPDNRSLISLYLDRHAARSDFAENGKLAVEKALSGDHDIVLMDLQMPEMDGFTATATLRGAGYLKPIIALSAHAMGEVRDRVHRAGANAHLPKPIIAADLIQTIANQVYLNQTHP